MKKGKRQSMGKHNNKVRLNAIVFSWQMEELDRIGKITGKSISEMVSSAIVTFIGQMRDQGV